MPIGCFRRRRQRLKQEYVTPGGRTKHKITRFNMSMCYCRKCFPLPGMTSSIAYPWCRAIVAPPPEDIVGPSILFHLPDDIWRLIFRILRGMMNERSYYTNIPRMWMFRLDWPEEMRQAQWKRLKQAIMLVSKESVL